MAKREYSPKDKYRYFVAVLYPESMVENWEEEIGDILQVPYCYCLHDKDLLKESDEERKPHIHCIIAFPNTTTWKHAVDVFKGLMPSCVYCEPIIGIRNKYDYLIHDTDAAKKAGKHLYSPEDRKMGNCFDIGLYEQVSLEEKNRMLDELEDMVYEKGYKNFMLFYKDVRMMGSEYRQLVRGHSSHFKALVQGFYQVYKDEKADDSWKRIREMREELEKV